MENQKFLSKDQVRTILQNAPKNTNPDAIVKALVSQGYSLEGFNPTPQKEPGLFDRVKSDISQRGANAEAAITGEGSALSRGIKAAEQGFGAVTDVGGDIIRSVIGDKPVDAVENTIKKGFNAVTDTLADTPLIKGAAESGQTTGLENTLQDVSAIGNIAGTIDAAGGAAIGANNVVKFTKQTLKDIEKNVANLTKQSEDSINNSILNNFQKGVKPTIAGQKTIGAATKYKENVINAVNSIKENAPNLSFTDDVGEVITGQTPKSLQQFADAIEQTKKTIFTKYDDLAKQAGESSNGIDISHIANELDTVIGNKSLAITNPNAIKYAEGLKQRLSTIGTLDFKTAQDVVQNYNKSLEAFYRNPSYDTASQAAIDSLIANKMRDALDTGIEGLTGTEYSALKKQYGALKSIEKDVVKAALRDARKNTKGLIDFTDILSGGQVVNGILSLNPGQIGSGLAQKAITEFYKYINNPNRAIENMFKGNQRLIRESANQTAPAISASAKPAISGIKATKSSKSSYLSTAKENLKNPKNAQGGFINFGKAEKIAKNIDVEDRNVMMEFIDAVYAGKTPSKSVAYKAQTLAEAMGLDVAQTNKSLAKDFSSILDMDRELLKKKFKIK